MPTPRDKTALGETPDFSVVAQPGEPLPPTRKPPWEAEENVDKDNDQKGGVSEGFQRRFP